MTIDNIPHAAKLAVAGATGFVGRALVARLEHAGHDVVPIARSLGVDIADRDAVTAALAGRDAAYYLVHSMATGASFRERDLELASTFGKAAARSGIGRVVYLGGLGDDPTSEHLASRQEVGCVLGAAGVPVVELRAAVVLGSGSISFEMLRYLTERLPAMVCPRWVRTAIQPIAERDLLDALERALTVDPGVYDIGGRDVTTYREMIESYARVRKLRQRRVADIPFLTPRLSSYWIDLITPVDRAVSHALVESLATEVVVRGPSLGVASLGLDDAIRDALDQQDLTVTASLFELAPGLRDGVYVNRVEVPAEGHIAAALAEDLRAVGGRFDWYGARAGWWMRLASGRLAGERLRLAKAEAIAAGTDVDWWTVVRCDPGVLVLRSRGWSPGDAWLGWRLEGGRLLQVGAFRPRGIPGFLYWKLLWPVHAVVFRWMARHRLTRARDIGTARSSPLAARA
jgi:uncharacterized protein YbjT (DUF2867 family)